MSRTGKASAAAGLAAGVAALLIPLLLDSRMPTTLMWRTIADFAHAPVFAVLFLLLLGLSFVLGGSLLRTRWVHYLLAAAAALAMAVGSELFQYFGNRDADLFDLLRNAAGIAIGLLSAATVDRRLAEKSQFLASVRARLVLRSVSALVLMIAFVPVALTAWAYRERASALPLLHGFDSIWERPFLKAGNAAVEVTPPPAGWVRGKSDLVGRVTFSRVRWPRLEFKECYPNWTGYESLALDLYSESTGSHRLVLVVQDVAYASADNRYSLKFDLLPGATTIRVPLAEVRAGPQHRDLDLARVEGVRLIAIKPPEPFTIWIDDLRLED